MLAGWTGHKRTQSFALRSAFTFGNVAFTAVLSNDGDYENWKARTVQARAGKRLGSIFYLGMREHAPWVCLRLRAAGAERARRPA